MCFQIINALSVDKFTIHVRTRAEEVLKFWSSKILKLGSFEVVLKFRSAKILKWRNSEIQVLKLES